MPEPFWLAISVLSAVVAILTENVTFGCLGTLGTFGGRLASSEELGYPSFWPVTHSS